MKSIKLLLSAAVMLFAGLTVHAQTADEIVARHLDAVGGKDKLAQVKTMVLENSIEAMGANSPATTTFVNGTGFKIEMEMMGQKIVQAFTGKGGWTINPMQGGADARVMTDDEFKTSAGSLYADAFLYHAAHGDKIELKGTEGDDFKLVVTSTDNPAITYYINKTSYNISKAVSSIKVNGNDTEITSTFSGYKPTEFGNVIPFTTMIDYGGMFSMTLTVKKATVNGTVDPVIFDMPK